MKARDLTYLVQGVYELETGNCEGHPREGDHSVIRFGCIETDFNVKIFEEDAEFQWDTKVHGRHTGRIWQVQVQLHSVIC